MVELKDIDGIISLPNVEGRFKEILSVQKIKDSVTGIKYNGVVDTDFLILINELNEENEQLKRALKMEEEEAEVYNLDAMNYQTLYEQQVKINKLLKNENKQLKEDIRNIRKAQIEDINEFERLYNENEQLKSEIIKLKKEINKRKKKDEEYYISLGH